MWIFCGHDIHECYKNNFDFIEPIWYKIKQTVEVELERVYLSNTHTLNHTSIEMMVI